MKRIIIEEGKPPQIEGQWTIGEIRAAAEFLARWIDAQQVSVAPPEDKKS